MGVVCTLLSIVPHLANKSSSSAVDRCSLIYIAIVESYYSLSILVPGELWRRVLNNCNRQVVSILRILAGYLPPSLEQRETRDNNGECNGEWRREGRIIFSLSPPPLSYLGVHRPSSTRTIRLSTGYLQWVEHPGSELLWFLAQTFLVEYYHPIILIP